MILARTFTGLHKGIDDALVKLQALYMLDTTVIAGMFESAQEKSPVGTGASSRDARRTPTPRGRSRSPAPPRRPRPDVASPKRPREKGTESKGAAGHRSSSGPHASGAAVAKPAVSTNVARCAPVPWMTHDARNRPPSRDHHLPASVANTLLPGCDQIRTDPRALSPIPLCPCHRCTH